MDVILIKDFKKLGKTNEIKKVADGYAQNFLFPNNIAVPATDVNIKKLKNIKQVNSEKEGREHKLALKHKETLESKILEIRKKTGESDKLYGAITNKHISEEIKEFFNISIDKKKVILKTPIKTLGSYNINIKLFENVTAILKLKIIGE